MKGGQSFDRINYLLRPNKHIERKLIFDAFMRLGTRINLSAHRYIGFGSMWFGDFLLAHRLLDLRDMWSIELEENSDRANFNKPYGNIVIKPGRSSSVLKAVTDDEWNKPCIAWLDYDGVLNRDVAFDVDTLMRKAAGPSIVLVTVNARRDSYRLPIPGEPSLKIPAIDTVSEIVGADCVPGSFGQLGKTAAGISIDVSENNFPEFLAESILNFMVHKLAISGRYIGDLPAKFVPLFNLSHVDGVCMVTVGGAIASSSDASTLSEALPEFAGIDPTTQQPRHKKLDLVQLTVKEKMALDRVLPADEQGFTDLAKQAGIKLPEEQLQKYRECYRHFPVFAESFF